MTRADLASAALDEDTALIGKLRRQLTTVTGDRDELLLVLDQVADALGLPPGVEPAKLVARVRELTELLADYRVLIAK